MMPMHGHGPGWRLPFILLALAGLSLAASSQEADNSGAGDAGTRVVVLVVGPGDSDTGDYVRELAASLGRALNAGGFVSETGESARLPLPEDIVALAESSGTPWIIVASCGLVDGKLVWQATGWDGKSGGIVAADSYSSYPGVGALPLIEESANNLVKAMTQSMKTAERPEPIAWPLRFSSPDEGAVVVLGPAGEDEDGNPVLPAGSINAGTIADGFLTAPYLPYFRGQKAMVTIMKPGFWPLTIAVPIKDDRPTRLPALKPKAHDAWGLDYGNGRILGIQAFYRHYLVLTWFSSRRATYYGRPMISCQVPMWSFMTKPVPVSASILFSVPKPASVSPFPSEYQPFSPSSPPRAMMLLSPSTSA